MFADLRPTFPTGPSVCLGRGGGGEGQQASSLSSKHYSCGISNRYRLVTKKISTTMVYQILRKGRGVGHVEVTMHSK